MKTEDLTGRKFQVMSVKEKDSGVVMQLNDLESNTNHELLISSSSYLADSSEWFSFAIILFDGSRLKT